VQIEDYILPMSDIQFSGTVVRVERDGFGVVRFDQPIGARANTHGIFSTTISSSALPYRDLKPGVHVTGIAEATERDIAAVKVLRVQTA
jgi:hypothetical protein